MNRSVSPDDAAAFCALNNPYVANTTITFEEREVSVDEMRDRIVDISSSLPWLVCEKDGVVAGHAYATRWKTRSAYRFSVESTIYLSPNHHRRGIGRDLYTDLTGRLRARGLHRVLGCIALPNDPSVALHESRGFKSIGRFNEVGYKSGQWLDIGYWQLDL